MARLHLRRSLLSLRTRPGADQRTALYLCAQAEEIDYSRKPIVSFHDLMVELVSPCIDELADLVELLGRPVEVFTACSGLDSPMTAFKKIQELIRSTLLERGLPPQLYNQVGACEIQPHLARFIERNHSPSESHRSDREDHDLAYQYLSYFPQTSCSET